MTKEQIEKATIAEFEKILGDIADRASHAEIDEDGNFSAVEYDSEGAFYFQINHELNGLCFQINDNERLGCDAKRKLLARVVNGSCQMFEGMKNGHMNHDIERKIGDLLSEVASLTPMDKDSKQKELEAEYTLRGVNGATDLDKMVNTLDALERTVRVLRAYKCLPEIPVTPGQECAKIDE